MSYILVFSLNTASVVYLTDDNWLVSERGRPCRSFSNRTLAVPRDRSFAVADPLNNVPANLRQMTRYGHFRCNNIYLGFRNHSMWPWFLALTYLLIVLFSAACGNCWLTGDFVLVKTVVVVLVIMLFWSLLVVFFSYSDCHCSSVSSSD